MKGDNCVTQDYQAVLASPLPGNARLGLKIEQGSVTAIDYFWHEEKPRCLPAYEALCHLLSHYFSGKGMPLGIPLLPRGTSYQQRVWQRLQGIPLGEVMTYGALARELNSSARAVAGACRANPIPILIPCHRVIARHSMGGYMGKTEGQALAIKQWLLQHEGYVREHHPTS